MNTFERISGYGAAKFRKWLAGYLAAEHADPPYSRGRFEGPEDFIRRLLDEGSDVVRTRTIDGLQTALSGGLLADCLDVAARHAISTSFFNSTIKRGIGNLILIFN